MSSIWANFDSENKVKRIDIWRESLSGIGRWETLLDNAANVYGGVIDPEDAVELKINGVSMLKGYVDDVLPNVSDKIAVYYELLKVVGRDYGQDLSNLNQIKEFYNMPFDDILELALASGALTWDDLTVYVKDDLVKPTADNGLAYICEVAGTSAAGEPTWPTVVGNRVVDGTVMWQCMSRSEITYSSPHGIVLISYNFKDEYLINGFREIVKQVNNDFWVDDNKVLQVYPLSAPDPSGVTLKCVSGAADNNILALDTIGEQVGVDLRNYVKVEAGDVNDHLTEGNASDWTPYHCTVTNDSTIADPLLYIAGEASVKATCTDIDPYIRLIFPLTRTPPLYSGYGYLDFSKIGSVNCHVLLKSNVAATLWWFILLMDAIGHRIYYRTTAAVENYFKKFIFPMGPDNILADWGGGPAEGVWTRISGQEGLTFDWSSVINVGTMPGNSAGNDAFWVDGLYLNGVTAKALAQDIAGSQATYRKRMITVKRPDLKSQLQLDAYAADELEKRKDPLQTLKVTATFQSGCKYAGQTVEVIAPSSGVVDYIATTADGNVGGTTVVDTGQTEDDDYWNGAYLRINNGNCAGQYSTVTDWDKASGTFTVAPAFTEKIVSGISGSLSIRYRILSLHHAAEPHVDLYKGNDAITEFELVKYTTTNVDPLRYRLSSNHTQAQIERLESRIRTMEKS